MPDDEYGELPEEAGLLDSLATKRGPQKQLFTPGGYLAD